MKKIPLFPTFKDITLNDIGAILKYTTNFPGYSDFNFVSLFTWNVNKTASYSVLNSNLVIRLCDYNDRSKVVYSLLGVNDLPQTIEEITESLSINKLSLVPKETSQALQNQSSEYSIKPDRDAFDYIYNLSDIISLEGPKYRKTRRSISSFNSKNQFSIAIVKIASDDADALNTILELTRKWRITKQRPHSETSLEYFAIRRAIKNYPLLPIVIYCAVTENKIVAFAVIEKINTSVVLHFEKVQTNFSGLASYFKLELSKILMNEGCITLNYEQDLGILGLREYKMSLKPSMFLEEFTVTRHT